MLKILYEDNHLIAVNKVAGDLVQGDRTGDLTLADKIKAYIKKKKKKKIQQTGGGILGCDSSVG